MLLYLRPLFFVQSCMQLPYLIIKAFSVQKISDNPKLSFKESVLINKTQ